MPKKQTGLVSLPYSDSENEDDSFENDNEDDIKNPNQNKHSGDDNMNESLNNDREPEFFFEDVYGDNDITIVEFHQSIQGKRIDELNVPPPTKRQCPEDLQKRIEVYYEKVQMGSDLNKSIQKRKDLRNPSIYEKMISYCQINEMATNYPKEIYNPEPFLGPQSFYEELSRLQMENERGRKELLKREKPHKENVIENEKKTKWDSAPANSKNVNSAALAVALSKAQNLVQINKPTVISAFGTLSKKK
ncbi:hypothetical protein RDWZM_009491 [Blomia tropicalis]|uniref:SAP30-binding protein n=1 Tax=Blomia tropicalis TaxID=40697 RepID=A0A9Q0RL27_BLOTA|nr:SAP30-binding protein [Blomia tropicalis]KAJ6218334.1 hypothetical protein RDWZM_009491 [Blomia tropicalis]